MTSRRRAGSGRPAGAEPPDLTDYEGERQRFSWDSVRRELGLEPGGPLNIAELAIDRRARGPEGARTALRWRGSGGELREVSWAELAERTARFAGLLGSLGVDRGERVHTLCGRIPELWVAAFGALRHGCVLCPLFTTFGPGPVVTRLRLGEAAVLVTTERLYRRKVEASRSELPALRHVLLVDGGELEGRLAAAEPAAEPAPTAEGDAALLHFTSGTTGTPKGALHDHGAALVHYASGRWALDLRPGDLFWCTADPGWVTGTSYGLVAPLLAGATTFADEAPFDADRWYENLAAQAIDVWYTSPTALRMLMRLGVERARAHGYPRLRQIAAVGEPLSPRTVAWGEEAFGLPIRDTWWQTETGGIMIANLPADEVRPGSMGRPLPGIEAAIVRRREGPAPAEEPEVLEGAASGELALRRGWPSMFRAYLGAEERYAECFAGDWYLTGDLARRDAEGRYWFVGRADDAIQSAGHLIGPFEVESALMEHPAVADVGAVGRPDPVAHEVVHAFVALQPGREPSDELRDELLAHARLRLGPAVAPRGITFRDPLPKTESGKILRRELRAELAAGAEEPDGEG